jgi:AcrR family transcriptional regulator
MYRHFADKQTLVRTVITERFNEFTTMLQTAAAAAGDAPMPRLQASARAYVRWGLEHPGHYRVLFSATNAGPVGIGLPEQSEHPGAASYRTLVDAVAACLPPRHSAAAPALATELWASLHGIVDLRITKPELPWPDTDTLVDTSLAVVRAATRPKQ